MPINLGKAAKKGSKLLKGARGRKYGRRHGSSYWRNKYETLKWKKKYEKLKFR